MRSILALAGKDIRLLIRDKAGFFFTFFFPLLYAIFFGAIFSGEGGGMGPVSIMVADEDQTQQSREFVERLSKAAELKVIVADRRDAIDRVRRGRATGYVILQKGFGQASVFSGNPPAVELGVDPSRRAERGMLEGILTRYAAEDMNRIFSDRSAMNENIARSLAQLRAAPIPSGERKRIETFLGQLSQFANQAPEGAPVGPPGGGFQPLQINAAELTVERRGPRNSYEISFPQGIIWGILGCVAAFGISIVTERSRGTLIRLRMAPISRGHILAGKALACFAATLGLSVLLLILGTLVFKIRPDSPLMLAVALVSVALGFVGIMMLLSALGKTEQAAAGIGWAVLLVFAMTGGGMVPLFIMPSWMQTASNVSPVKWAIVAIEGAIWRQFSWSEMALPCVILLAVGTVCFAVGTRALRWTE